MAACHVFSHLGTFLSGVGSNVCCAKITRKKTDVIYPNNLESVQFLHLASTLSVAGQISFIEILYFFCQFHSLFTADC